MANPVQAHPEADQLQAFSRGALADEAASQWISSHLESCPACLRTLESLSSDTLESLVRAAQKPDATADYGGAAPADAEADDLSFLAPPQAPDEIGRLGPYRVLKVLGSGGMGIVFQAEDISLKRRVALKVMKLQAARRPKAKERFLREAQAAAAIEHDHIVTIHQVGEERGVPFLAMQWLKGMSLEDRLRTTGDTPLPPLNTQQIVRIGQQIAVGLTAAHEQGLIHRDIKPANLWLTPVQGGRIKILDFGLARALADDVRLTQSGTIVGTPAYMAPEQGRGDNVDHRCDLFSLGVVLYRLTTGRLPFRGESTMAVLTSLAMDTPEAPRKIVGELPATLSDLIMQLLAKDPAQRPATARAVTDRLQRIDQQLVTSPLQPGQTEAMPIAQPLAKKPSRKRPVVIAAALGALALLIAGAVFFLQTPDGTVRIEIDDASIEAILTKTGAVIKGADKTRDITVAAGEHALKIKRGDLEFETDKFVLKKGDTVTLKVELLPGKVQVVRDGKVIGEKALSLPVNDRKAAAWVLSLGGTVLIDDGQQREVQVRSAKDLPAGPLTLRNIHLSGNQQVDDAGLKNLAGLKSLRILHLEGTKVTAAGLEQLAGLKELTRLSLGQTSVTDAGLKPLATLKNLQMLNLKATAITDARLENLATLEKLYWLQLTDTKVTDAGLKKLARLPRLQDLDLGGTSVTDAGLKELAALKSLQALYLAHTDVTDAGLAHLQTLTNLKTLDLTKTKATAQGVAALQKALPGCKIISDAKPAAGGEDRKAAEWVLSLGGSVTIDDGQERKVRAAKDLPAGPWTLHNVNLNHNEQVDDAGLKKLAGLKGLHELYLFGTKVTDVGLKELANLKDLHILNLDSTRVTDAGLKELAGLKGLQMLYLSSTPVTSAGLRELAGLKSLRMLALFNTKVTDAGLKELAGLQNLWILQLSGTPVTDAGLVHLRGLTELKTLEIKATGLTAKGVAALQKAFPGCQIYSDFSPAVDDADRKAAEYVLSIGGTVLIDDGQQRNVSAAKDLPAGPWRLLNISLSTNKQVDDAGLKVLAGLKSLRVLNLDRTKVTDAGLEEMAGLKELHWLSFSQTSLTDAGLKKLAGLKNLHLLNLNGTSITDAGLKELADLKTLYWLQLVDTKVTDAGLKQLASLQGLQELNLGGTSVTDAGLKELAALKNLQALNLGGTSVTGAGLKELADLKRLNSLALPNAAVTDAGLKGLAGFKGLTHLNLMGTKVTDAGLVHLQNLTNLKTLELTRTKVTAEEIAVLQKALPALVIAR